MSQNSYSYFVAMLKNSKCWQFLSCLEFAILNSIYCEVVLKPKQVICLEKVFLNLDILAVLPTGHGKLLVFPRVNGAKRRSGRKSGARVTNRA